MVVLLHGQRSGFTFLPGPLEAAGFQPLVKQHKSVAFPVKRFDPISASTAEQEQGVDERIQMELLLNHGGQTVNAAPQVGVAAGDVYLVCPGKVTLHDFRIRNTVSTVAESAPLCMLASTPEMRTLTATFPEQTSCGGVTSAKAVWCTGCCSDSV